eukprot:356218-Chlamydomonas_euryale.AAC.3
MDGCMGRGAVAAAGSIAVHARTCASYASRAFRANTCMLFPTSAAMAHPPPQRITGKTPRFRVDGGTPAENLALQNIQASVNVCVSRVGGRGLGHDIAQTLEPGAAKHTGEREHAGHVGSPSVWFRRVVNLPRIRGP